MEHLSTEKIKKYAAGEYPYSELLKISSHIFQCQDFCQKKLNEIAPEFLKMADALEFERERIIQTHEHFSDKAIADYVGKRINLEKRLEMNAYFTKCAVCAEKLKAANPDYLSDFIKDTLAENKTKQIISDNWEPRWGLNLLIPAGALIILFVLMLGSVWLKSNQVDLDQTKLENKDYPNPIANVEEVNSNNGQGDTNVSDRVTSTSNNESGSQKTNKPTTRSEDENSREKSKQTQSKPSNKNSSNQIVTNRSLDKNCEPLPDLAITPRNEVITDTQPVLKWKTIPKAVGYQVYLTDTKSNLIEETTTKDITDTSYKLTTKLELNKKYEWKVIAILDDGKEVFGDTTQFSVGEKAKKLIVVRDKSKINDVRCITPPKK